MTELSDPHALLHAPVLEVTKDLQIIDHECRQVAQVTEVVGPPKKGRIARFFDGSDNAHRVLRVAGLDARPLFFVDRPAWIPTVRRPPCAIVAPDGRPIGRFEHDVKVFAESQLAGAGMVLAFDLLDATGRRLGRATFDPFGVDRIVPDGGILFTGGRQCVLSDANGVEIAQLDTRKRPLLRLHYALPDPLRLLVVASPLALPMIARIMAA